MGIDETGDKGLTQAEAQEKFDVILEEMTGQGSFLGDVFVNMAKALRLQGEQTYMDYAKVFEGITKASHQWFSGEVMNVDKEDSTKLFAPFLKAGLLDEQDVASLYSIIDATKGFGGLTGVIIFGLISVLSLVSVLEPLMGTARQKLNSKFTPVPPDPALMMRGMFIAPEQIEAYQSAINRSGISDEDLKLMLISQYQLYDVNTIRDLYLRGEIDKAKVNERLAEHGFTDERIGEMTKTWIQIPGLQDIIYLLAKEAFEPDMISRFGLGAELPVNLFEHTRRIGVSDEIATAFWTAHWDHPQINLVMEMLHRNIIDWETVEQWFKLVEIPPFWREKIREAQYTLLTRVDIRRMHDMGVLSYDDVVEQYAFRGYSPVDAERMAAFTEKYNLENDRELTKAQLETGYKDGILPRASFVGALMEIGYRAEHAEYIAMLTDNSIAKELEDDIVANIKERYTRKLITEVQARGELNKLAWPVSRIEMYLARWKSLILEVTKFLSKTDLEKALQAKIITELEYTKRMQLIGYSLEDIDILKQIIQGKEA